MKKNAENLLLQLYAKKRLAPFYVIRGPISSSLNPLLQWARDFATQLISSEKKISSHQAAQLVELGHQDLLFITKAKDEENPDEQDGKAYKVDDPQMRQYFKAVQYGPIDLAQKFIFIDKAQLINEYFANKWLKTLEEPAQNVTTLFLVETQMPLLDTIESRAITFRVKGEHPENDYPYPEQDEDFSAFLKRNATHWSLPQSSLDKIQLFCQSPDQYHHLLSSLKVSPDLRNSLFELMNDYMLAPNNNLHAQQRWLTEIRWFKEAKTFNNSAAERFVGLLMCVMEARESRPSKRCR